MSIVPANIERLVPYSPGKPIEELERELGITGAIKLASNENPVGPSPKAISAMEQAARQAHRYPDAATWSLREALAKFHDLPMEQFVIGNGSNELIDLICRTYAGPDDHAIIGIPSFVCYHLGLTAANVPYDAVPLRENLYWDVDALLAKVVPETKILFLANPNNPTGTHLGGTELKRLVQELPEHVILVLDEAYIQFADSDDYIDGLTLTGLRERMIVLRTFSKAYGLAALRVGYAVGPAELIGYLNRTRAPFNVSSIGQAAAIAALADQAHVQRYVELNNSERSRITSELRVLGYEVAPSQANFVFVNFGRPGKEVYDALLRKGVIIRPMPAPVDTWLRVSVGLAEENTRMLAAVKEMAS